MNGWMHSTGWDESPPRGGTGLAWMGWGGRDAMGWDEFGCTAWVYLWIALDACMGRMRWMRWVVD